MIQKPKLLFIFFGLFLGFNSCELKEKSIFQVEVYDLDELPVYLESLQNQELNVLFFLSPECPLCQNYSVTMKRIIKKYGDQGIGFYGIFPGKEYSPREIKKYLIRYELEMEVFLDPLFDLTELLEATITPEVIVLNRAGKVLYQGAFDNWAIDLGTKRNNITDHYLNDALDNAIAGLKIDPNRTKPVGCYIQ